MLTRTGEQRYRGEIQLTDPASGRALPVEALAGTILSDQGELVWVVTILHDLTEALEKELLYERLKQGAAELERKIQEATAELAQQNELLRRQHIELEQASALKTQFLANISHEFRTPLNAILGYTHMLLHGVTGAVTEPQRKSLTRIDSNSRHLLQLINEILDITRIEAGRMPLTLTRFKVPDLVIEVMSELEPIIRRSNLAVTARMRPELPMVRTDRQKVKQIVLNLLSNALKFTPSGSVTIGATFDRAHALGRDRRSRHRRRHSGRIAGQDLRGLPTARQFADERLRRHRPRALDLPAAVADAWRLDRSREPGGPGIDVYITAAAGGTPSLSDRSGIMGDKHNPLVLVVEDYQDAREMYAAYLQFSGYRVAEAVERARGAREDPGVDAGHHPDGPGAAEDGRLGGDAAAESG